MSPKTCSVLSLFFLILVGSGGWARTRTVGIVPDPACRSNKLVLPVETTLPSHLRAPKLKVDPERPEQADMLLQYFVSEQRSAGQIQIQLDASVVGKRNGRLYGEGSVRSDAFPDDENGRIQAAKQAAQRLGEQLSTALAATLQRPGRARRIMLQIALQPSAAAAREPVLAALRRELKGMSLRQRGSTARNLMLTLFSTERSKDLAEQIETAVKRAAPVEVTWQVRTKSTLMLQLRGASR